MDRERLDEWCEQGIIALVWTILMFGPLALGGDHPWQFLVIQGLTIGAMALWAARLWIAPKPKILWPPICWAVVAFVLYAIVRYFQSDVEYPARKELIRIIGYAFLFIIILNNLHRQETMQRTALAVVFTGMTIAMYAGYQFLSGNRQVWNLPGMYEGRASGTFIYPNALAGFLEMALPLALCQMFMSRLSHIWKIVLGYASVVMLAGIAVTFSRGGWLVTLVGLVILCGVLFSQRDYRIQGAALLGCLILAGALAIPKMPALQQRFQTIFTGKNSEDTRASIWRAAAKMWADHPVFGLGPAQFDYNFPAYRSYDVQARPAFAHNDYLNTLVDYGAAGLALILVLVVLLYWGLARSWRFARGSRDDFSRKKSNKLAFLTGAALGLTAILLHSAVDFNLHMPSNAILAITLAALLTSQWRFATERFWFSAGLPLRSVATLALLAGVAYLGFQEWRGGWEFAWGRRVERNPLRFPPGTETPDPVRLGALERELAVEPMNPDTIMDIGDCYQNVSRAGGPHYEALARTAMTWYRHGVKLDPHDTRFWLACGECLDWIKPEFGPFEDSSPDFWRANELDPNSAFVTAKTGRHYFELGDLAAARTWLERSHRLDWRENRLVEQYLPLVTKRLDENAAPGALPFFPGGIPAGLPKSGPQK